MDAANIQVAVINSMPAVFVSAGIEFGEINKIFHLI